MIKRAATFAVLVFALSVSQAIGLRSNPPSKAIFNVSGAVTLLPANTARDAADVAVWLVPEDPSGAEPAEAEESGYRMVQHDKKFVPDFLVVPIGSVVVFPNLDPWFHNVFSLYQGKKFDLGLYQAGAQKSVRFDRLGPSYIFCNIHPQMTAVILTVGSPYFAVSDKTGRVSIAGVPAGRYWLRAWYENAAPNVLQALRLPVVVGEENRSLPSVSIQVARRDLRAHKNKYGRDYDTKPLAPKY